MVVKHKFDQCNTTEVQRRNRYYECSRISEYKFRLLIRYFALDSPASGTPDTFKQLLSSGAEIDWMKSMPYEPPGILNAKGKVKQANTTHARR